MACVGPQRHRKKKLRQVVISRYFTSNLVFSYRSLSQTLVLVSNVGWQWAYLLCKRILLYVLAVRSLV